MATAMLTSIWFSIGRAGLEPSRGPRPRPPPRSAAIDRARADGRRPRRRARRLNLKLWHPSSQATNEATTSAYVSGGEASYLQPLA